MTALAAALLAPAPAFAIVTSNSGPNSFTGLNVNNYLGANTFYTNGYTGTRSVVANVEAGQVWNGHETLTSVTTFLKSPDPTLAGTQLGQYDRHATWVGQTIAGRQGGSAQGAWQQGIAYGTTLWSGAIATQWTPPAYATSFNWSNGNAFLYPYLTAMQTGVSGRKADVVNSSWGGSGSPGNNVFTLTLDGLVRANGTTFVVSAGNSGPGANTVGWPANGFNTIAVGALGSDTDAVPFNTVSSFSSRSPSDVGTPTGTIAGARAAVDIAAPGQNLTLAYYGGTTGGNTGGTDPTGGANNLYNPNNAGTSFAAPIVAGGAALLVDVGYDKFGGGNAVDGRVIKAVLLNSADKIPGWDNGQSLVSGVVTTTQALDYASGAGRMNLTKAYDQYVNGTAGGAGTVVSEQGWKFGSVAAFASVDYTILPALAAGSTFTATLTWFANRTFVSVSSGGALTATDDALSFLELQLWLSGVGGPTLVADSKAQYNTTQHFSFNLTTTGNYFLRVLNNGIFSQWGGGGETESFGLAWVGVTAAVPEPSTYVLAAVAAPLFVWAVRRRAA